MKSTRHPDHFLALPVQIFFSFLVILPSYDSRLTLFRLDRKKIGRVCRLISVDYNMIGSQKKKSGRDISIVN